MTDTALPTPAPIEAVLFDFHSTLVDQGDARAWLASAWRRDGRDGTPAEGLGAAEAAELTAYLDRIWEHSRPIDPTNRRDYDPQVHRRVWDATLAAQPHGDQALYDALYATMLDQWVAYDDTLPTLRALRAAGIRLAVLSNVGIDLGPVLEASGIAGAVDAVVLSYLVGYAKPDPEIFAHAVELLGVSAERTLMVGDSWRDDSGAAGLGIRTLILPRTTGPVHGLSAVTRLVGLASG